MTKKSKKNWYKFFYTVIVIATVYGCYFVFTNTPFSAHVVANKDYFQIAIGLIGLLSVFIGWFLLSYKNRTLQRKQLSIELLNTHRFEEKWIISQKTLYSQAKIEPRPNWVDIYKKYSNKSSDISDNEKDTIRSLFLVVNYFEFLSISMRNKAIDEDMIEWSLKGHFKFIHRNYGDILEYIIKNIDKEAFCNYYSIKNKWHPEKIPEEIAH